MSSTDVLEAVLAHAGTGPDRPAVKDLDRELTYGHLHDEVAQLAAGLAARGIGPGDRVGLFFPNSVDFVVAALACMWVGAIFVPLAVTDPPARLGVIVGDCDPALVLAPDGDGPGLLPWPPVARLSELAAPAESSAPRGPDPTDGAYIIYTSGTTGTPNGVLISRGAFAAAVTATAGALELHEQTRTLCVSPFHFDGSFATLFPTLFRGGAVVIRPREALLFPRTFFNAVASEGITYTGFSPTYLRLLLAAPQLDTLAGTPLRVIALGGEASSPADVQALWAAAPDVVVFNRYGPTETTIAVTHMRLSPEEISTGTVPMGRPHDGVTFHLLDDEGRLVEEPERVGELHIGGVQLMIGYWEAPDRTAAVLRHDLVPGTTLYRTGDLVYRNGSGDYVYVDRSDRVINRNGVRISLVELGDTLRNLAGVSASACLTYDNEGQVGIAAFVVADPEVGPLDLRQAARRRLPDNMLPDRIELVPGLPLTASSKLDEAQLRSDAGLAPVPAGAAP